MAAHTHPEPAEPLTDREQEVLDLLRLGLTNRQIAQRLGISADGAKYHVSEIIGKLGVRNRYDAAVWPEGRPWWSMGALSPVALLRRAQDLTWLSPAVAGALAVVVAAGVGLLVWGVLAMGDGGRERWSTAAIPSPPPVGPAPPLQAASFSLGEPINVTPGVFFVDVETGAVEGWWSLNAAQRFEISPDGRIIFYDAQRFIVEDAGACAVATEPAGGPKLFSTDGSQFVASWSGGIAFFSTACGGEATALALPPEARLSGGAWSPDGRRLIIRASGVGTPPNPKEPPQETLLVDVEDGSARTIEDDLSVLATPKAFDWSPDSSRFVLTRGANVMVFDKDGNREWEVSLLADSARNPRWSPDGRYISVHTDRILSNQSPVLYAVHVLRAEDGSRHRLIDNTTACWGNPWNADGSRLVTKSAPGGKLLYGVYDIEGGDDRNFDSPAFFAEPSPSDPDIVAYLDRPLHAENGVQQVGPVTGPLIALSSSTSRGRPVAQFAEGITPEWDPHYSRRWLDDGRLVLYTTTGGGRGGCEYE